VIERAHSDKNEGNMNTSKAQEGAPKLDDVKKECRLLETALKNGTAAIKLGC
jgi:hypothetical protein